MILVSINPFALHRFYLVCFLSIFLSCLSCVAAPLLVSVNSTPYDRQMARIRPDLNVATKSATGGVTMHLVNSWIGNLRSIPYGFTAAWKTPAETESGAPADCKAKAVALYVMMRERGATNFRLIIGRRTPTSRSTHTWVEWETPTGNYVLDPTINWMAYRTADTRSRSYIPYYAYAGNRKYRAASTDLFAAN